jgi:hypothetical protein
MRLVPPRADTDHAWAKEQLPWHVAQTLDEPARQRMTQHLSGCADCRRRYEQETVWVSALRTAPVVELAPQAGLAHVMSRIDGRERRRARLAVWLRPWQALKQSPALAFATAVQAAAIAGLVLVVVLMMQRQPASNEFRTLSNAEPAVLDATPRLRLVFDDRLTSIEIRQLLDGVGGQIIEGPGPQGIFTVSLPGAAGHDDAQVRTAVDWLRARPGVRFAEVVAR